MAFAIAAVIAVASCARADAFALNGSAARSVQDPAAPSDAERTLFTQGQNLYLQGSYTTAAEVLEKFLVTHPNSILTDLTLLWLGRSYIQLRRFSEGEEVGKRLRTIKDTPFADIYENELKAAMRDAGANPGASVPARVAPAVTPQATAPTVSQAVRDRYAKPQTSSAKASPVSVKKKTATPPQRSATQRPGTRPGTATVARNSNNKPAPKPSKAASTTARRPSTSPVKVVRPGVSSGPRRNVSAANKPVQRNKTTPSATKTSTATSRRAAPRGQTIAAKPKAGSLTRQPVKGTTPTAKSATRAPGIANRERRQIASGRTPTSNQRSGNTSNNRRTSLNKLPQRSAAVSPPTAAGSDNARPVSVSGPAVTGGLYSMIDTAMTTAPAKLDSTRPTAPANVAPESRVDARSKGMNAKPGETIYLSFVVRNYGTIRQTYELRITAPGAPEAQLFVDSNGDGMHQSDELRVTGSPVIELKNSEVPFLLEVKVPRTAFEGQQYFYTVTVLSFGSGDVVAKVTSTLTVSSIRATLLPVAVPEPSRSVQSR